LRVRACKIDGGAREDVAAVAPVTLWPAVMLQDRVEIATAAGWVRRLTNAAPLDDEGFLKALIDRPQRSIVTQMPLAEDPCPVPRGGQDLRQRDFIGVH